MKENIVVIGSGWAGASLVKHLDSDKFNITVISNNLEFVYTPLLTYKSMNNINLNYPIVSINDNIKTIKKNINIEMIDFNNNSIKIDENNIKYNIKYNYIVFANGATINTFNIEGVETFCHYINNFNINKVNNIDNIYVIGTGPTGTEMIGHLLDYKKSTNANYNIIAIDGLKGPLNMIKDSSEIVNFWKEQNIDQYYNNFVKKITDKNIITTNNNFNTNTNDVILWLGGVKITPLSIEVNNFFKNENRLGIDTNDNMMVKNSRNVFAIGDCNGLKLPPTAQVAYQQGKFLANNFNNNSINNSFTYNDMGSFFYYGQGNSVYNYKKTLQFGGKLTGYLNNFVHLYNCINFKQSLQIFKEKYLK